MKINRIRALVLAICNQKGGAGKTTTALAFAYGLAGLGMRVCVVDFDESSNLTLACGVYDEDAADVYDWIMDGEDARKEHCGFDVIPSTRAGVGALVRELQKDIVNPSGHMRAALEKLRDQYDVILVDTPPHLGLELTNALVAADAVIVTVKPEYLCTEGFGDIQRTIKQVRAANPGLRVAGAVVTQLDTRTSEHEFVSDIARDVAESLGSKVFATKIRLSQIVPRSQRLHKTPLAAPSRNPASADYKALIGEVIDELGLSRGEIR